MRAFAMHRFVRRKYTAKAAYEPGDGQGKKLSCPIGKKYFYAKEIFTIFVKNCTILFERL